MKLNKIPFLFLMVIISLNSMKLPLEVNVKIFVTLEDQAKKPSNEIIDGKLIKNYEIQRGLLFLIDPKQLVKDKGINLFENPDKSNVELAAIKQYELMGSQYKKKLLYLLDWGNVKDCDFIM